MMGIQHRKGMKEEEKKLNCGMNKSIYFQAIKKKSLFFSSSSSLLCFSSSHFPTRLRFLFIQTPFLHSFKLIPTVIKHTVYAARYMV